MTQGLNNGMQKGFTIVELLIVIVVIGILAAITIVSFNGIQARAQASVSQAALTQAAQKLATYLVDNPTYPIDQSAFSALVPNIGATSFQYTANTSTNPGSYCITATTGATSYKSDSTNTAPVSGGCAGHGVGGVAAITNMSSNPGVETDSLGWSATFGTGGIGTSGRVASTGQTGGAFYRLAWSTAPTSITSSGTWVAMNASTPGAVNRTYTASAYLRSSWAGGTFSLNLVPYSNTWSYVGGETYGANITLAANTWTRFTATVTAPAGTENMTVRLRAAGGTLPIATSTLDGDSMMLVEGTTAYNYADGNTANWIWTGTTNGSASTGPAV